MKIILIRPPLKVRPLYDDYDEDEFWIPLSYTTILSSVLTCEKNVKVYNCPAKKNGWKTLRNIIKKENPDIVMSSCNETMYVDEIGKLSKLTKEINKNCKFIIGGSHASALPEEMMSLYPVDIVVLYEGDVTIIELIKELSKSKPNLSSVKGIAFKNNEEFKRTEFMPLIENLDDLPLIYPAYELLQNNSLKTKSEAYGLCVKIQSSRGCIDNCTFCAGWIQMGRHITKDGNIISQPVYRQKSVERVIEEIEFFYKKYKRQNFYFVDDCFNVNPDWNEKFSDKILRKGLKISYMAFLRSDFVVRDEKRGIFGKMVKAGLVNSLIGVERCIDKELIEFDKEACITDTIKQAYSILKKYPQVHTQSFIIVGKEDDSKYSVKQLAKFCFKELKTDSVYPFCLTPHPGTIIWERFKKSGLLEKILKEHNYSKFDEVTPLFDTKYLNKKELFKLTNSIRFKSIFRLYSIKRIKYEGPRGAILDYLKKMTKVCFNNIKRLKNLFSLSFDIYSLKKLN